MIESSLHSNGFEEVKPFVILDRISYISLYNNAGN